MAVVLYDSAEEKLLKRLDAGTGDALLAAKKIRELREGQDQLFWSILQLRQALTGSTDSTDDLLEVARNLRSAARRSAYHVD